MKKHIAVLLSLTILANCCMVHAGDISPAVDAWLPTAIDRLEKAGMPDDSIAPFLENIIGMIDDPDVTEQELNAWLDELLSDVQGADLSQWDQSGSGLEENYEWPGNSNSLGGFDWQESSEWQENAEFTEDDGSLAELLTSYGSNLMAYMESSVIAHVFMEVPKDQQGEFLSYASWLADQAVHVLVPQAVDKLLQIPAFAQAAQEGLLSRYMALSLPYDPEVGFGAMVSGAPLTQNNIPPASEEEPIYNTGYVVRINLSENGPEARTDDAKRIELEDTLLHEMTHAFMMDFNRNGMLGTDRYGERPLAKNADGSVVYDENGNTDFANAFPDWFCEGTATSVQAGYTFRRNELLDFFGGKDDRESLMNVLSDRDEMRQYLTYFGQTENAATLKDVGNAYNVGYVACMFLYSMAAQRMGLDPFQKDENGSHLNEDALREGFSDIIQRLHDGWSLDQIIKDISLDPAAGTALYENTADFEEKFAGSAEDPGLEFWQMMMLDYEAQCEDPSAFIPSGSILPGYDNGAAHYMDSEVHDAPAFYAIVPNPEADFDRMSFPVSTVQASRLALTGGRSISYDPVRDALTDEERVQKDITAVGEQPVFVFAE